MIGYNMSVAICSSWFDEVLNQSFHCIATKNLVINLVFSVQKFVSKSNSKINGHSVNILSTTYYLSISCHAKLWQQVTSCVWCCLPMRCSSKLTVPLQTTLHTSQVILVVAAEGSNGAEMSKKYLMKCWSQSHKNVRTE